MYKKSGDLERCLPYERERMKRTSQWLDKVTVLGNSLDIVQETPVSVDRIDTLDHLDNVNFGEEVATLNMSAPLGSIIHFRGPGFTWALNENSKPTTNYKNSQTPVIGSGAIKGVLIAYEDEIDYGCGHCLGLQFDVSLGDNGQVALNNASSLINDECISPDEDTTKIYLEVEHKVFESDADDLEVGGSCVKSNFVTFTSLLIASELSVEFIPPQKEHTQACDQEDLPSHMNEYARRVNQLVRDTAFRRLPAKKQRSRLEQLLESANNHLAVDRFNAYAQLDTFYITKLEDGYRSTYKAIHDLKGMGGVYSCALKPIRVDSLDAYGLGRAKTIRHNNDLANPKTSLYLVCEIEPALQSVLEIDSDLAWIPICPPRKNHAKKRGGSTPAPLLDIDFYKKA